MTRKSCAVGLCNAILRICLNRFYIKQYNIFIIIIIIIIIIMVIFVISALVLILKCFIFPSVENYGDELPLNLSLMQHGFQKLNRYQETAVREALSKPFTLIQGPPGTSCASCDLLSHHISARRYQYEGWYTFAITDRVSTIFQFFQCFYDLC